VKQKQTFTRYLALGTLFLAVTPLLAACGADAAPAATPVSTTGGAAAPAANGLPALPAQPIKLQIVDVGGTVTLLQPVLDNYKKANPDKVSDIQVVKALAPDLPGKLKAQQDAGKVTFDVALSGFDAMYAGVEQGLWVPITPNYDAKFPGLKDNYLPQSQQALAATQGMALPLAYTPSGPLFEYNPAKVPNPPKTIDDLKAWIKANPGKFEYAQPDNSGPGRTLLMGLPYLLHDKDPKDPINGWANTWAFLKDIDGSIDYYPNRTSATMTELADGTRWIIASTMGWDISPRVQAQVPKGDQTALLDGTTFVSDSQFVMIPKGLSDDHLAVALDLMSWILKPDQQAVEYDSGYFYPGPAVKGVTLSMAPAKSQAALKDFGRPEYDDMAQRVPVEMPLAAKDLLAAFAKWKTDIGGAKLKTIP